MKHHSSCGMMLDNFDTPITIHPDVEVRAVDLQTALNHSDGIAEAYGMGMTGDAARHIFQSTGRENTAFWTQVYIVYERDSVSPIGFCVAQYLKDEPIVVLGGSSTFPQWRGKNVYKTMVAKRLSDAKQRGAKVAMIQTVSDTSAPICRKLGFVEFCNYDFYIGNIAAHE